MNNWSLDFISLGLSKRTMTKDLQKKRESGQPLQQIFDP